MATATGTENDEQIDDDKLATQSAQPVDLVAAEVIFNHKSKSIGNKTPGEFIQWHCQQKRNGGGDVQLTIYPFQGDVSRALVVFDPDPNFCDPGVVQSLARNCKRPIKEILEFSDGQCFGKGSIFVSPRLQKKLLEHFEPDKIFNHLLAETGISLSSDSWCLTGYFFQLKLAEDCLKRLEKDADQKAKAQGGGHLQGTSKQALSDEALENERVLLSAASLNEASKPTAGVSSDVETRDTDPTNVASRLKLLDRQEDSEKETTKTNESDESVTSGSSRADNQLNRTPNQPTSSSDSSGQALPSPGDTDTGKGSSHTNPPPSEVEDTSSNRSDPTPPDTQGTDIERDTSGTDSTVQPLILTHQLRKQKFGLPASFVSGGEPERQESLTEDENALNTQTLESENSAAVPESVTVTTTTSTATTSASVTSSLTTPTTVDGVVEPPETAVKSPALANNSVPASILPTSSNHSKEKRKETKNSDSTSGHKTDNSEHQEREKQKSKKKTQANPTEKHSGPSPQNSDTVPQTAGNTLKAEDIPLPDSDTETPSGDEEAENPIPKKAKADESRKPKASGQSMASDRRFKASRSKLGTSYVYDVEEEFDQIYYEFVTTVLKAKFDDRVTKKFSAEITQKTSPKDTRMILVNIRSFSRHQSEDMMEALNNLYTGTMRKLHSNIIKLLYDGDKRKLAKALIEELPKVYPGEQFIARLVSDKDIRIVGYLKNYEHDEHVAESFVSDYKKRNPAPQQSYAKTSDIRLSNGATVRVIKGDLTKMKCDAIVSSSGTDLAHRYGVSNAIALACGQKFAIDGRRYVEQHGEIPPAGIFTQPATGRLQQLYGVSYVIHAIAPSPREPGDINTLILQTVLNALTEADTLKCRSVALPAICSGRMGVPLSTCANCYWLALDMFAAKVPTPILKEINFVVDDMQIVLEIDMAFKQQLADKDDQMMTQSTNPTERRSSGGHSSSTGTSRETGGLEDEHALPGVTNDPNAQSAGSASKLHPKPTNIQLADSEWNRGEHAGRGIHTSSHPYDTTPAHRSTTHSQNLGSSGQPGANGQYTVLTEPKLFPGSSLDSHLDERKHVAHPPGQSSTSYAAMAGSAVKNAVAGVLGNVMGRGGDDKTESPFNPTAAAGMNTRTSSAPAAAASGAAAAFGASAPSDTECPICMEELKNPQTLGCSHKFCKECLDQVISTSKSHLCPTCRQPFRTAEGKQPRNGKMNVHRSRTSLPGYERYGSIVITYTIYSGVQGPEHPHPGQRYEGTSRTAFLPDNSEGRKVERLLKKAFDQRLIFTIGQSVTTGRDNCVVWNDIHHKTNIHGGPSGYGYPDPEYLARVTEDLKAKGVTE